MITLDILASHLFGEFMLQTDFMAKHWSTGERMPFRQTFLHTLVYTVCFLPFVLFYGIHWLVLLWIFVTHFAVDMVDWSSPHGDWLPRSMMLDQTMHIASLAALMHIYKF